MATRVSASRQFRLLTLHCAAAQAATSLAGGFVGAYLMKIGLGLPAALCVYAAILAVRFALRLAVLPLVRRVGLRRALLIGIAVGALQFWPLAQAEDPRWLLAWIGVVALSESLYWPILHAASAVTAAGETRGRQIAARPSGHRPDRRGGAPRRRLRPDPVRAGGRFRDRRGDPAAVDAAGAQTTRCSRTVAVGTGRSDRAAEIA